MRNPKSTDEQKIDFLKSIKKLWAPHWTRWRRGDDIHDHIVSMMRDRGLVSRKTGFYDINLSRLFKLIKSEEAAAIRSRCIRCENPLATARMSGAINDPRGMDIVTLLCTKCGTKNEIIVNYEV